jgi:hypothetical protein
VTTAHPRQRRWGPGGRRRPTAKGRSVALLGFGQGSATYAGGGSGVRGGGKEGVRREVAAPCIRAGRWLIGSEEDKGFGSLSGCDLDSRGLREGEKK